MKPAAAAAQPEYELSIDTTTGMSPPPIAATRCRPEQQREHRHDHQRDQMLGRGQEPGQQPRADDQRAEVQPVPAGRVSGADFIFADSFR